MNPITEIDRRKTYYKVTNKEECHNDLQYHDGLVEDILPFNDNSKDCCGAGRIYFTNKEHLHRFFGNGTWIRPIRIPEGAKVLINPSGDKMGGDKVFMYQRQPLSYYFKHLFDLKTFPAEDMWYLAAFCSEHFDKWYNADIYPARDMDFLAEYCSTHFDKWWNAEKYPAVDMWYLVKYCSEHFDKWYDANKYPAEDMWALEQYCSEYKDKWEKEVL